ncbi:PREDICTED: girdin-like [Nicrophorus vespilloides]|uniref:Girdin-like n=1 Tax=Nicrophorus vespilloides TaxID=110193 RepID=A0ABM1M6K2_NICVS|nr:PREDICTED: girdin-like [Nicrophorus vespilloides]
MELVKTQNEIKVQKQENELLKAGIGKQETRADDWLKEKESLNETITNYKKLEDEVLKLEKKRLESESMVAQKTELINKGILELARKDEIINNLKKDIESNKYDNQKTENVIKLLEERLQKSKEDNSILEVQVEGLKTVLAATGSGEIARELSNMQRKLTEMKSQYLNLLSVKDRLEKQVETDKEEKKTLVEYQKTFYDQLQNQQKEIDNQVKSIAALNEQLDKEKNTVNALQNERMKHLQEKTILTAISQKLKGEITKLDQLETSVSTSNKRANKLAMMAQYNKQLEQKLREEVAERDDTITKLKTNMELLHNMQMENSKEKVALCEELNQVFHRKTELDGKLAVQLERNMMLSEHKHDQLQYVTNKLKEIQENYGKEKIEMEKNMEMFRNENEKLLEECKAKNALILEMQKEKEMLIATAIGIKDNSSLYEAKLRKMQYDFKKAKKEYAKTTKEINNRYLMLKNTNKTLTKEAYDISEENQKLKNDFENAKITLNRVFIELNEARSVEETYKNTITEKQRLSENLQNDLNEKNNTISSLEEQQNLLKSDLTEVCCNYEKLTNEYNKVTEKLKQLKENDEMEEIVNDLNVRDEEILVQQERIRTLEMENDRLGDYVERFKKEKEQFLVKYASLEADLFKMKTIYETTIQRNAILEDQVVNLKEKEADASRELIERCSYYEQSIGELKSNCWSKS